jgi:hypothetical protein
MCLVLVPVGLWVVLWVRPRLAREVAASPSGEGPAATTGAATAGEGGADAATDDAGAPAG